MMPGYKDYVNRMGSMPSLAEIVRNVKARKESERQANRPRELTGGMLPQDTAGGVQNVQIAGERPMMAVPVSGDQDPRAAQLRAMQQGGMTFEQAMRAMASQRNM